MLFTKISSRCSVIRDVCKFVREYLDQTERTVRVGINISARQFVLPDFLQTLESIVTDEQVSPKNLDLEITENLAAMEIPGTISLLQTLQEKGYSISIDDLGTGYSSLRYLRELPFDVIKIDRSFISPLPEDKASRSIVRSIISMAANLGKQTVAEGIETEEQNEICRIEGCDTIQGYYLSRPLPREGALRYQPEISRH